MRLSQKNEALKEALKHCQLLAGICSSLPEISEEQNMFSELKMSTKENVSV